MKELKSYMLTFMIVFILAILLNVFVFEPIYTEVDENKWELLSE